ncbi:Cdc6/Cdc18 family protein [Halobaculum sp. MBLA0147]|uniref:Cdc6/Cdc18 family protein n=1 Tax=Halobaculum sp. MBLA0147 TaxID=3079934 RepID=UPI0035269AB3
MITDARPLAPEFVPSDVVHRDAEVNTLSANLRPIIRGEQPNPSLLVGPSGTGKTCIARYTVDKLREEALDVETPYVNCWEDYSPYRTLYRILDELTRAVDIHRTSTPQDELVERLREYDEAPVVVILDEVDQLEDKDLLYDLFRVTGLSMVLIANREEALYGELEDRLQSRLQTASSIRFDPYPTQELVNILTDRARWSLREDAYEESQLRRIAESAAGDARVAIMTLREAARYCRREGLTQLTSTAVDHALPEAKAEIRQKNVERLTEDQQALYEIVQEAGEIRPAALYEAYQNRVDDPKTDRTVRNYLEKMERYNLICARGENRGRTYVDAQTEH